MHLSFSLEGLKNPHQRRTNEQHEEKIWKQRDKRRSTYNVEFLLSIEPQFLQHLRSLLHHECPFIGVRLDVTVHLCWKGSFMRESIREVQYILVITYQEICGSVTQFYIDAHRKLFTICWRPLWVLPEFQTPNKMSECPKDLYHQHHHPTLTNSTTSTSASIRRW